MPRAVGIHVRLGWHSWAGLHHAHSSLLCNSARVGYSSQICHDSNQVSCIILPLKGVFSKKRGYICLQKGRVGCCRSIRKATISQKPPSVTSDWLKAEICSALYVKGMHKVPAPLVCMSHIYTSLIAQVGRSWCNSSLIHHCKTGSTQKQNTLEKFWISTCQKELVHEESWRSRRNLMS